MSKRYPSQLNADQRRAVAYGIKARSKRLPGPLLILAGAGTGKTRTIGHRITHSIVNGVDPSRMLLLVFGRRAAQEMSQRTATLLQKAGRQNARINWAGTFHSIGARFVRKYARRVGLRPNFTIMDQSDAEMLMGIARGSTGSAILPNNKVCLTIYSKLTNTGSGLGRVLCDYDQKLAKYEEALAKLFSRYDKAKLTANVADFDDLLKFWLVLLSDNRTGNEIRRRFDYVFVDEYQDTNWLQAQILLKLKPDGRGLTVVGDDAQSIYSFRGARVTNILEFSSSFAPPARIIKLEQNYRSTQPILSVCNAVLDSTGLQKKLWSVKKSKQLPAWVEVRDGVAQAHYVAESIIRWRKRGGAWRDCAVLIREALHSTELELEFVRQGIPFNKCGGPKLLDATVVRQAIAILRWCENPRDRSAGLRVLQLLPGIGTRAPQQILNQLQGKLSYRLLRQTSVPGVNGSRWRSFTKLIRSLMSSEIEWESELAYVETWFAASLPTQSSKLAQLRELRQLADRYSSRGEFLTEAALDPPEPTAGARDCVTISTIHSAKGREWKHVTALNAVDGYIPSARAETAASREEERRLFHVATSRAKDRLEIIVPRQLCLYLPAGKFRELRGLLSPTPFIRKADLGLFSKHGFPKCKRRRR